MKRKKIYNPIISITITTQTPWFTLYLVHDHDKYMIYEYLNMVLFFEIFYRAISCGGYWHNDRKQRRRTGICHRLLVVGLRHAVLVDIWGFRDYTSTTVVAVNVACHCWHWCQSPAMIFLGVWQFYIEISEHKWRCEWASGSASDCLSKCICVLLFVYLSKCSRTNGQIQCWFLGGYLNFLVVCYIYFI